MRGEPPVYAILLAAGAGRRFGGDKLLAELPDGRTLFEAAAEVLADSPLAGGVAVIPAGRGDLADAAALYGLEPVENPDPARGMGRSLALGAGALAAGDGLPTGSGLLVALADMPDLTPALIAPLLAAFRSDPGRIVVPAHGGRRGHPVIFPAALVRELTLLDGDVGGRELLARHASLVREVAVGSAAIFRDVDTVKDLPTPGGDR